MTKMKYSSKEFEAKYTYSGNDLGAVWSKEKTVFRLWSPTASQVTVNLYRSGTPSRNDLIEKIPMQPDINGSWIAEKDGNLDGVYYTYQVVNGGTTAEVCDPYARTTGVNGHRAMVVDLDATNPEGWADDQDPNAHLSVNDAIIYELHIRDLSSHESSGIHGIGKYSGVAEAGTHTPSGIPTGLDHMKALGITHLHILPMYDYGSVDETNLEISQFNWGYDPVNFNTPEGSYSTNAFDGAVRVRELKNMIKTLHDYGISVVMDVVYNHVYDGGSFCFNKIVPGYFSRIDGNGIYSNGSGCGNDTASERSMVKKYIVDSVKYWADEYHIDGFRFDLVGLLDINTVNQLDAEVHKDHPNVIFYGEGWSIPTQLTKENVPLAVQANAEKTPNFAYFNDTIRDLLKGSVFSFTEPGFVSGAAVDKGKLFECFKGHPNWCPSPTQTVNYVSCHDNMTLFDRIKGSLPNADMEELAARNRLAAAFCLTAQGIPFFQAGEEFLRSKTLADGTAAENSYNLPDEVNQLRWDTLNDPICRCQHDYYKGLIAFRKNHSCLRLSCLTEVEKRVHEIPCQGPLTVAYRIDGSDDASLILVFHAGTKAVDFPLPEGKWDLLVYGQRAGNDPLACLEGNLTVPPLSAAILTR